MKYASLSTTVLRGMLLALSKFEMCADQQKAIREELAIREWASEVEQTLYRHIRWQRGGLS